MAREINPNEAIKAALAPIAKDMNRMSLITVGVIIVLFIGLAASFITVGGMIVNYEAERQTTYEDLKDQVTTQNAKIDALTQAVDTLSSKSTSATLPATQ